ncbi:hypothetical protein HYDPIDRAFT_119422 [Hydnomerulius pinastri MD-312]|uniref:Uncharacterized protein n=1 Tax=Hydnomerulius pinastri MD-312 TaxID=994086 RepID=A0A0C9VLW6_9AGAM|nr:hypothetical protein HYDPIDRAFT_119422 [Hydnomerulius pinastri MD-312]
MHINIPLYPARNRPVTMEDAIRGPARRDWILHPLATYKEWMVFTYRYLLNVNNQLHFRPSIPRLG